MKDLMLLPSDTLPLHYINDALSGPLHYAAYTVIVLNPVTQLLGYWVFTTNTLACLVCAFIPVKYNIHNFAAVVHDLNNSKAYNLFHWNLREATFQSLLFILLSVCGYGSVLY